MSFLLSREVHRGKMESTHARESSTRMLDRASSTGRGKRSRAWAVDAQRLGEMMEEN